LAGLIDTGGSVIDGRIEFCTGEVRMCDAVTELAAGLGFKPVVDRVMLDGGDCGVRYRVTFTVRELVEFGGGLAGRCDGGSRELVGGRYIIGVNRRGSVPVRCIQVDSSSHLFLVSESFIATHNTRTGAETVRMMVESGRAHYVALVAPTSADARDVMVEGESGIMAVSPPWFRPVYEPSKRRLTWSNGARATLFSADEPERLRGPQFDLSWCDELAAWRYPEAWDMLMFALRLGGHPRAIVTTTPKPRPFIKELARSPTTIVTHGSTYDNRSNLSPSFYTQVINKYEGTRLGRQELDAEILEDVEGALWTLNQIDGLRRESHGLPYFRRVVVAVDPAVTAGEGSDETGIVVCAAGADGHGYVLSDVSCRASPREWARRAIVAYHEWSADRIVAEVNQGGDLVENTIKMLDPSVSYESVRATRGKYVRAEPVAALYENGRVHHVGRFPVLEDQMTGWVQGGDSPDRLDAMVWGLTVLFPMIIGGSEPAVPTVRCQSLIPGISGRQQRERLEQCSGIVSVNHLARVAKSIPRMG